MTKFLIAFLFLWICSSYGQQIPQFNKHLDAINVLVSKNSLVYYVGDGKGATNSKVKVITAEYSGRIHIYDSICNSYEPYKCICQKQNPSFNVLEVSDWKIYEGYAYLKNNENQTIGRIYGLKIDRLNQFKTQFDSLKVWCQAYEKLEKKAKQDYITKRDALPNPRRNVKQIAAQKEAEKLLNEK